jgi:hypothetical protein
MAIVAGHRRAGEVSGARQGKRGRELSRGIGAWRATARGKAWRGREAAGEAAEADEWQDGARRFGFVSVAQQGV